MDIRQLQCFLCLYETMNYSRAAERLFLSRQALRGNIRALEADLGEPLFTMEKNRLHPTARGSAFMQDARRLVGEFAALEKKYRDRSQPLELAVERNMFPFMPPALRRLLEAYAAQYAGDAPRIRGVSAAELMEGIRAGRFAAGILPASMPPPGFESVLVNADAPALYLHCEHPLSRRRSIPLESLEGELLFLPQDGENPLGWSAGLLKELAARGIRAQIKFMDAEAMVQAVRRNEGLGFGALQNQEVSVPTSTLHIPLETALRFSLFLLYGERQAAEPLLRLILSKTPEVRGPEPL